MLPGVSMYRCVVCIWLHTERWHYITAVWNVARCVYVQMCGVHLVTYRKMALHHGSLECCPVCLCTDVWCAFGYMQKDDTTSRQSGMLPGVSVYRCVVCIWLHAER